MTVFSTRTNRRPALISDRSVPMKGDFANTLIEDRIPRIRSAARLSAASGSSPRSKYDRARWSKISSKSNSASAENSSSHIAGPLFAGNHPLNPGIHFNGRDHRPRHAPVNELPQRSQLQCLSLTFLPKQFKPLLKDRTQAGILPRLHEGPSKAVLRVRQRDRRFYSHDRAPLSTGVALGST